MSDEPSPPPADGLGIFDGPPPIPGEDAAHPSTFRDAVPPPPGREPVNPGWRAAAWILDAAGTVVVTMLVLVAALFSGGWYGLYAVLAVPALSVLLSTVLTAIYGVTPGKAILGIRVVNARTGDPIGPWAILRSLVLVAPVVLTVLLIRIGDSLPPGTVTMVDSFWPAVFVVPSLAWLAMFVVVVATPRHRGLQDRAARSVVVRR